MKKVLIITLLTLAAFTASAQTRYRGIALGADRDTLKFLIASPFDNWYINVGGGIQTFIGNEIESSARHNKLNFNGQVEIGKWIIPDIAVSLRYSIFNVDGQTRYPLNPFVDFTDAPIDAEGYFEYQPFHAHAMSFLGLVSLDWTNLFNGYEIGKRTKLHWRTSAGLGLSMLYGNQINPRSGENHVGDFRRNFELAFIFSGGFEYALNETFAIFSRIELFGSESTWDWSPYDNSRTIFDIIPSLNAGLRYNVLSHLTRYHYDTRISTRDTIYHEFQTAFDSNTVRTLQGTIAHLESERESIIDSFRELDHNDSIAIDSLNDELDRVRDLLKRYEDEGKFGPRDLIPDLLDVNKILGLPSVVVYFELDKYNLDYNARKKLQEFAKKARDLSDTIEFYMIGSADSLTGSIPHNQWLSERRCEAVYKLVTENFGLSGNQFTQVYAGGINDEKPQENNRRVLVIQRTPITEEIVERFLRMSRERMEEVKAKRR